MDSGMTSDDLADRLRYGDANTRNAWIRTDDRDHEARAGDRFENRALLTTKAPSKSTVHCRMSFARPAERQDLNVIIVLTRGHVDTTAILIM